MCEACSKPSSSPSTRRRLFLWELDPQWHCPILGTCLGDAELRGLLSREGIDISGIAASEYQVHSFMVQMASANRNLSRVMHKMLDRKFALSVRRFARMTGREELAAGWKDALSRGEVGGALWAVMTHSATDESLRTQVFGDVHMLSHQVGAATRAELRRIHELEKDKAELDAKVKRQQERFRREITARDATIKELRDLLDLQVAENKRLADAAGAAQWIASLEENNRTLTRMLDQLDERFRASSQRLREMEDEHRILVGDLGERSRELAALQAENDALEERLEAVLSPEPATECAASCSRPDLCGRCILYVGGRLTQLPHLQKLVSERNGVLLHHDGGMEESMGRLRKLLGSADAVVFPVDHVSHAAHDHLKTLCRRWSKPFVPIRRAGLGAFIKALDTVAVPETTADAES